MSTKPRIYIVQDFESGKKRLVRATGKAKARSHVTRQLSVSVASQDQLVSLLDDGCVVENATPAQSKAENDAAKTKLLEETNRRREERLAAEQADNQERAVG